MSLPILHNGRDCDGCFGNPDYDHSKLPAFSAIVGILVGLLIIFWEIYGKIKTPDI